MEAKRDPALPGGDEPIADSEASAALARDMIDVHGPEAATVARNNARAAAVAAQLPQAKVWIRVLGMIQRQTDKGIESPAAGHFAHRF